MLASSPFVKRDVDDFLFEAKRRLLASPLDYERAFTTVARLAVPRFADVCSVHMLQRDDTIVELTLAEHEPEASGSEAANPAFIQRDVDEVRGATSVIRTGVPLLVTETDVDRSTDEVFARFCSFLSVPIAANGVVLGAFTFAHTSSKRHFEQSDLPVAEELGRRAGQALENALRFEKERSAREGLMRLSALTAALAKPSLRANAVARLAVDGGCHVLGAPRGVFDLRNDDGITRIVSHSGFGHSLPSDVSMLPTESSSIVQEAIHKRSPIWSQGSTNHGTYGPCVVVPLIGDDQTILGTLTFGFDAPHEFDETDHALVDILAIHSAHALERANLLQREHRYHERLRILADAGELLAETLDYDATIENVARLAMPVLADFCFFEIVGEDGAVKHVPSAHENPHALSILESLDWPPPPTAGVNVSALSTGRTGHYPSIDDTWLRRIAPSLDYLAKLRSLKLCSLVTTPLVTAGERLGSITVCYGKSGRHHTEGDVALVEELARRAAVALKNTRLYKLSKEATLRAEEAAREAEEASRLKDEFLATVSHELRTPLSSILGWASLLRGPNKDPSLAAKGLEVIERNARSQQRLVEDILDVSRIVTGKLRIDTEPVDLGALSSDVLESVRPAAFAKSIELTFEAAAAPFRLAGDSVRLRQILWNLLSNAVKFTPPGGRVWLELEQLGDRMLVRIRDTGKGIDPSFLPHVFERFRQADSTTTREYGGLGLGLAIVRHLTEIHGGHVDVSSEGLGLGATFSVSLPIRPFSSPIERPTARQAALPITTSPVGVRRRLEGLRVVVAEDERDSRDLIALLLGSEGAIVRTTSSSDAALEAVQEYPTDVVLSDIGMPGRDGYWLANELRRLYPEMPSIALTAYSTHEDVTRAIGAGFHSHVAKPVDPELLVEALTKCCRKSCDGATDDRFTAA